MCWNKDVSINTFLFSFLGLLFIYYANTYTKYKTAFFTNIYTYLFIISFSSMQLLEYFIWKNINNQVMNTFLSKIGLFIIFVQPLFAIMMTIDDITKRNIVLFFYFTIMGSFLTYKKLFNPISFKTTIAKNGHLMWNWFNFNGFENIIIFIWLFFFFGFWSYKYVLFQLILLFICLIRYFNEGTFGSMWCWFVNFFMLYFIIDILLIQPFLEYQSIC